MERINNEELKEWRLALYNIPLKKIAEDTGLSVVTLRQALKYELATPDTQEIIRNYVKTLQVA